MEVGRRRHNVAALLEFDVTAARERMRQIVADGGPAVSFTGWLASCVSKVLGEFPEFNAHRQGRRRVVRFADVDVMFVVERKFGDRSSPIPFVLRKANELTVFQISDELRAAQGQGMGAGQMTAGNQRDAHWLARVPLATRIYPHLPTFIRAFFWRIVGRHAFLTKRIMGTVGITAVGMFGRFPGWPITTGLHTVNLAVGGIVRKPVAIADRVEIREMLAITLSANHDLIDGAPAARLVTRLGELIESGYGLG
jgi:pyruvate/2-oxoglutarate dehydrogenase complex dihydrolipoamide acyltransferase (E2) component